MGQCKSLRFAFPRDEPVRSSSPSIPIDEERKFRVVQEEFPVEPFDGNGHVVLAGDEIQRGIREVQERLCF